MSICMLFLQYTDASIVRCWVWQSHSYDSFPSCRETAIGRWCSKSRGTSSKVPPATFSRSCFHWTYMIRMRYCSQNVRSITDLFEDAMEFLEIHHNALRSLGQQQRINFARVLLRTDTQVALIDEGTSACILVNLGGGWLRCLSVQDEGSWRDLSMFCAPKAYGYFWFMQRHCRYSYQIYMQVSLP